MKVVFAGTPEFAATALNALLQEKFNIPLVLTQPDRPAGRGMQLHASAVKQLAQINHIPVLQPISLRLNNDPENTAETVYKQLADIKPDVMVVVAYGLILPVEFLQLPRFGCLNIHASLLPRWRGAAPIQRAIEAGDKETGITIMQMEKGLDTGPILMQKAIPITENDSAASLHNKLAVLGGELICKALYALEKNLLEKQPQDHSLANYAAKIMKNEAAIDFSLPADITANKIRAFNPFPGAQTSINKTTLKIWNAKALPFNSSEPAGKIIEINSDGILVSCGNGILCITELQRPGGKRMPVEEFIKGFPLENGQFS